MKKKIGLMVMMSILLLATNVFSEGRSIAELKECIGKQSNNSNAGNDLSELNGKKIDSLSGDFLWDMELEHRQIEISEEEKEHLVMGKPYKLKNKAKINRPQKNSPTFYDMKERAE